MEWLKGILEKAEVKDGKLDVDAVMKAVSTEFPKHAVPKKDFNEKAKELETANDTILELKKENGDNEKLQAKIGEYETEIGNLKKEAEDTKKTYALKEQLSKQGVLDSDYLIYKAGGLDKFSFDNQYIPLSMLVLGCIISVIIHFGNVNAAVILGGMISGLASTGLYEMLRNLLDLERK